jgi:transcriptional regulator with XRE-family HTH domain
METETWETETWETETWRYGVRRPGEAGAPRPGKVLDIVSAEAREGGAVPDMPGPWGEGQREAWQARREALGAFIREQRKQANLSLRQLAEMTRLSNPYLSQIERGLHQPSVRVLRAISDALNLSAETLLTRAGLIDAMTGEPEAAAEAAGSETERAIRADKRLSGDQKSALIAVYRSMLSQPGT